MNRLTSWLCRVLFVVAFVLAALGVLEKLANASGYTLVRGGFSPGRLLELAAVALLFVIALLLRDIRHGTAPR